MDEPEEGVPPRVAVHLDLGAQDEDLVPRLAGDRIAGVAEGVVRAQETLAHDAEGDDEGPRHHQGANREGDVAQGILTLGSVRAMVPRPWA